MVSGNNKQRVTIDKEDATSPTTVIESEPLTSKIDTEEGRDVTIIYMPNTFI